MPLLLLLLQDWGPLYFVDGLHFTGEGNQFVLDAVEAAIKKEFPDLE